MSDDPFAITETSSSNGSRSGSGSSTGAHIPMAHGSELQQQNHLSQQSYCARPPPRSTKIEPEGGGEPASGMALNFSHQDLLHHSPTSVSQTHHNQLVAAAAAAAAAVAAANGLVSNATDNSTSSSSSLASGAANTPTCTTGGGGSTTAAPAAAAASLQDLKPSVLFANPSDSTTSGNLAHMNNMWVKGATMGLANPFKQPVLPEHHSFLQTQAVGELSSHAFAASQWAGQHVAGATGNGHHNHNAHHQQHQLAHQQHQLVGQHQHGQLAVVAQHQQQMLDNQHLSSLAGYHQAATAAAAAGSGRSLSQTSVGSSSHELGLEAINKSIGNSPNSMQMSDHSFMLNHHHQQQQQQQQQQHQQLQHQHHHHQQQHQHPQQHHLHQQHHQQQHHQQQHQHQHHLQASQTSSSSQQQLLQQQPLDSIHLNNLSRSATNHPLAHGASYNLTTNSHEQNGCQSFYAHAHHHLNNNGHAGPLQHRTEGRANQQAGQQLPAHGHQERAVASAANALQMSHAAGYQLDPTGSAGHLLQPAGSQPMAGSSSGLVPGSSKATAGGSFRCATCNETFSLRTSYQAHVKKHSQDKNNRAKFSCDLCGHSFSQKTSLNRHMKSHTGERPFPCEICAKAFSEKERLKIHMRTHTGEKPFSCNICGKSFSQKSTVKRHQTVHTGEKKFRCDCGKGFANRGNLIAHIKTRGSNHFE